MTLTELSSFKKYLSEAIRPVCLLIFQHSGRFKPVTLSKGEINHSRNDNICAPSKI